MHSRILRSTALATAIVFASPAFAAGAAPAQSTPSASAAKPQAPAQRRSLLDELDLTATQQSSVRAKMQQDFQQLRPQMQAVAQKRQAFADATPGSSSYQSAVNDLAQAEANFAKARTLREGALRSQIYELLTPAQRTRLKDLMAEQKARFARMREAARAPAARSLAPPASH
jgi:Spy/CpxP family protein refolding chaperone